MFKLYSRVANIISLTNVVRLLLRIKSPHGYWEIACQARLSRMLNVAKAQVLLTPSCTSALEICALLLNLNSNDEVIVPSFTFSSSALPFYNLGAKLVFADVDGTSGCMAVRHLKEKITENTKCVVMVNYGGWNDEADQIATLCRKKGIVLVEDAAQSIVCGLGNKRFGTYGDLSTFSFHRTKNIHCFEGGALIVNDKKYLERANLLRDKGTNYRLFLAKKISNYSWVDNGTSGILGEINCAFLYGQLLGARFITRERRKRWKSLYDSINGKLSNFSILQPNLMVDDEILNGHIFALILEPNLGHDRNKVMSLLNNAGIECSSHYQPLHLKNSSDSHKVELHSSVVLSEQIIRINILHGSIDRLAQAILKLDHTLR